MASNFLISVNSWNSGALVVQQGGVVIGFGNGFDGGRPRGGSSVTCFPLMGVGGWQQPVDRLGQLLEALMLREDSCRRRRLRAGTYSARR